MSEPPLTDQCTVTGQVTITSHRVADCREQFPDWESLSAAEKLQRLDDIEPAETRATPNTTVDGLHRMLTDHIDPNQSATDKEASHVALGTSDTAPSTANTSLNNEQFRTDVTDSNDQGTTMKTSTFIAGNEANGHTYKEAGLVTGPVDESWTLLNHSTFTGITKDDTKTLTIEVSLTFSAA